MKRTLWIMVLGLVLLHQDYWQWDKSTLVFGFLPYSLAYHAALSLLAAAVWWSATQFFWPTELEVEVATAAVDPPPSSPREGTEP